MWLSTEMSNVTLKIYRYGYYVLYSRVINILLIENKEYNPKNDLKWKQGEGNSQKNYNMGFFSKFSILSYAKKIMP